ncbi:MAG: type IV toxin-antitoxin system AbiEi family antitoxin domain-containing protein [Opitutaceae bacterium]|jgi:predicted transcriptional regulator of viral defense system
MNPDQLVRRAPDALICWPGHKRGQAKSASFLCPPNSRYRGELMRTPFSENTKRLKTDLYPISLILAGSQVIRNNVQKSSWELGPLESRLLSWSQMTGEGCVRTSEVAAALRMPLSRTYELLGRMAQSGIVIQLARGLYLLPEKLPPGGRWQPPIELALWFYLQAKGARWQETGLMAFNRYGLSEQAANVATVYNDKVSGRRRFGKLEAVFIKVDGSRLGDFADEEIASGIPQRRRIGTLARVVLDAVYDYSRFGSLPNAYRWIAARREDARFCGELVRCANQYGNVASRRRIGWLLERIGVAERIWTPLRKSLKKSSAFIPVDPSRPARGATNSVWGVVENYDSKQESAHE